MAADLLLTTEDNPYSPFTQWDEWYAWDERKGHHTTGLIARFTVTSDELSEEDQDQDILDAMQYIVDSKVYGAYKLVPREFQAQSV